MKLHFSKKTLKMYLDQLSSKEPVPGGGSAAALTAALGAGLVSMVCQYSIGRKTNTKESDLKFKKILKQSERYRDRFLELASLDSEAYLEVCKARNLDKAAQIKASRYARAVPLEICKLCYKTLDLVPYLVDKGNPYLLSDIQVSVGLLEAGFNGAMVMVKVNS
jgi:formiminotetrahydrofolate cyclodeaminase